MTNLPSVPRSVWSSRVSLRVGGAAGALLLLAGLLVACGKPRAPRADRSMAVTKSAASRPAVSPLESPDAVSPMAAARANHPIFQLKHLTDMHIELDATARAALHHEPRRYARGTVVVGAQRLGDVGVRLKGHRSFRELGDRPSFILDFKRFSPKRRLFGLRKLILNGLVEDPTMVREALGYALFRQAGVAAPHVGYVRLRVNGGEPQVYLAVEPLDKDFVSGAYTHDKGNLYEGEYGCDANPEDVWGFDLAAGRDTSRSDLKALVARMPQGVTALFADAPGAMDQPRVLSFLAMSVVIGDFDGYEHHHNYFLYHDPVLDRWSLLPWGIDRAFFEHLKPYASEGLIARVCFGDRACRLAYVGKLQAALGLMQAANLPARVSEIDAVIGAAVAAETNPPYDAAKRKSKRQEMMTFIAQRAQKLRPWTGCLHSGIELDRDRDGYGCMDCDDHDAEVHPGAEELCDGIDNDCTGMVDDAPACPCVRHDLDGVHFELCDLPMPWRDAARYCAAKGMTLARIDSKAQSEALYRAARRLRRTRWWIGLNDLAEEDVPVWRDGSKVTFTYWKTDEPSDMACGEDCAALAKRGKGKWYDSHCGIHRAFICRAARATAPRHAIKKN